MEPRLRPAAAADIDLIVAFSRRLNQEDPAFTGDFHFDEPAVRGALAQLLADPSLGRVWLICIAAEPVGYVALTFGFSLESHGRDLLIDEIYLLPDYRGRGIGRWVIRQLEAEARGLGIIRLYLEVERPNRRAQAFYRQLGFEDHNRYLMSKWIA
ncbi:MAG: GNAT family N-acetyltransferase [Chloroflexota bacterium]